ncbi:hypothetical protein [Bacillus seohaeanensis]|jgi:hypothetical protein|uniref:Uncharacterized protein n=1 Tax=Bacillus seohaeanensis TaxID=284580 RepID=A0ABW5RPC6_9BACI
MSKKMTWIFIVITLAVNVVMLQWTIEAYYGQEYEHVWIYSAIAVLSSIICFLTYWFWRKKEYS